MCFTMDVFLRSFAASCSCLICRCWSCNCDFNAAFSDCTAPNLFKMWSILYSAMCFCKSLALIPFTEHPTSVYGHSTGRSSHSSFICTSNFFRAISILQSSCWQTSNFSLHTVSMCFSFSFRNIEAPQFSGHKIRASGQCGTCAFILLRGAECVLQCVQRTTTYSHSISCCFHSVNIPVQSQPPSTPTDARVSITFPSADSSPPAFGVFFGLALMHFVCNLFTSIWTA
mmetsp:Transcript_57037/g.90879  ORF Transcript_57037/g.90879 Transcript_57037/m.90879 type:complete len:228 (-) Transcript_57037:279-962(-)